MGRRIIVRGGTSPGLGSKDRCKSQTHSKKGTVLTESHCFTERGLIVACLYSWISSGFFSSDRLGKAQAQDWNNMARSTSRLDQAMSNGKPSGLTSTSFFVELLNVARLFVATTNDVDDNDDVDNVDNVDVVNDATMALGWVTDRPDASVRLPHLGIWAQKTWALSKPYLTEGFCAKIFHSLIQRYARLNLNACEIVKFTWIVRKADSYDEKYLLWMVSLKNDKK